MEGCTEAEFGDYKTVGNVVFLNKHDAIPNEYTDCKKAAGWYKKAMEHGSAKGAFNYACMLHFGKGVKRNYKKAFGIFSELFNINYPGSPLYMGLYYAEGLAVKTDYDLARRCYILGATTLGDAACYNQLGVMYAEGLGVKRDYNFAMEYYKIAAESGDGLAAANVGWMYSEGNGAERNYAETVKWYEKAMEIGFELAEESAGPQNALGWMYQNGLGVAQDYKKAVELYIKAAEQGNPDAQSNLGAMYENGFGVAKNRKKAISWYEKAAEQGDLDAVEALKRLAGQ
jgi:TPR repeat protein